MNFVGRKIERSKFANLLAIVRFPVRQFFGRKRGAGMRHIFVTEKFEQVRISRLHDLTNHLCGFRFELVLVGRLNSNHRFPEWCVEQIVFGFALRNGGDGFLASLQSETWWREAARKPRSHVRDLFAEIARDVAHLRDPVFVIGQRLERSPRRVAQIGPESRIRVGRHFVVTEFLIGDEILDFRPINIVVDLLLRRELRARNIIQFVQHILPVTQSHLLRRRIYAWQAIGDRFFDSFEPGKLLQSPFPFFGVDSSQPLICVLRPGKTRDAPQRSSTKQNGGFQNPQIKNVAHL